jgi:hypothetical protein
MNLLGFAGFGKCFAMTNFKLRMATTGATIKDIVVATSTSFVSC